MKKSTTLWVLLTILLVTAASAKLIVGGGLQVLPSGPAACTLTDRGLFLTISPEDGGASVLCWCDGIAWHQVVPRPVLGGSGGICG